ncbi:hypothetical protein CP533_5290 [Ophiocordyceps camponoti-saundersi (nom. inval.)]|nr:hypothetical protein CP533_5290 [Ophiocordyceps camponoti-saundersi (nom. inval.)]
MLSLSSLAAASLICCLVSAHGTLVNIKSDVAGPEGIGFRVERNLPNNCSDIIPCQQDSTIIRPEEIAKNLVNPCGRTQMHGNIDVGQETEKAIQSNEVPRVRRGSKLQVTLHQVNADGAGPYKCDLDETSNGGVFTHNLTVNNNVPGQNGLSLVVAKNFTMEIQLPDNFTCIGASLGNICTVRCQNNAHAGNFGGCFPIQQEDVEPHQNTPETNKLADDEQRIQSLPQIAAKEIPKAIEGIKTAGDEGALIRKQGLNDLTNSIEDNLVTKGETVQSFDPQQNAIITGDAPGKGGANQGQQNQNQNQNQNQGGRDQNQNQNQGGRDQNQNQNQGGRVQNQNQNQGGRDQNQNQGGRVNQNQGGRANQGQGGRANQGQGRNQVGGQNVNQGGGNQGGGGQAVQQLGVLGAGAQGQNGGAQGQNGFAQGQNGGGGGGGGGGGNQFRSDTVGQQSSANSRNKFGN